MTTPDPLDSLERLAREATGGPWHWRRDAAGNAILETHALCQHERWPIAMSYDLDEDTAFIAAANPQAILQLIARLRRAEAVEVTLRSVLRVPDGADLLAVAEGRMAAHDSDKAALEYLVVEQVARINTALAPPQSTGGEA